MTPQDQWTYKFGWIPKAYQVSFHSDLLHRALRWLRANVPTHQWHLHEWTNVYEHTVWFELYDDKQQFEAYFCD